MFKLSLLVVALAAVGADAGILNGVSRGELEVLLPGGWLERRDL